MNTRRVCLICDTPTDEVTCVNDGAPTVRDDQFDDADNGDLIAGSLFDGRYRIGELLGSGGMARVHAATQVTTERPVAVKVLKASGRLDREKARRFFREARLASALESPEIVRTYDFGIDDTTRTPFLVMERLEGETLSGVLARGPLNHRLAAAALAPVARALVTAHAKGIVHRDIKPSNIFCARKDGRVSVKVMDFGIAKRDSDDTTSLTATDAAIGTPRYMSPEQARGGEAVPQSDLYALGCVLHCALVGGPPFSHPQRMGLLMQHVSSPPPALPATLADGTEPSVALRTLHARLLAKQPNRRGQATEVVAELERMAGDEPLARLFEGYRPGVVMEPTATVPAPVGALSTEVEPSRWPVVAWLGAAVGVTAAVWLLVAGVTAPAPDSVLSSNTPVVSARSPSPLPRPPAAPRITPPVAVKAAPPVPAPSVDASPPSAATKPSVTTKATTKGPSKAAGTGKRPGKAAASGKRPAKGEGSRKQPAGKKSGKKAPPSGGSSSEAPDYVVTPW